MLRGAGRYTQPGVERFGMDKGFQERARRRRQGMSARLARTGEQRDAFEGEREGALEPFRRAEAVWSLVCDLEALRGENGAQLRLDRSLARVERRGR